MLRHKYSTEADVNGRIDSKTNFTHLVETLELLDRINDLVASGAALVHLVDFWSGGRRGESDR